MTLNGAQMHEVNKFIGTATTLVVVGFAIYSHHQEQKEKKARAKRKSALTLVDFSLDTRDRNMFNDIVRKEFPK